MKGLYLSAAHKSSGKTTVMLGICAALQRREVRIAPFKKGPDYIDPAWLGFAAGEACYNLDFYTSSRDEIVSLFRQKTEGHDVAIIEGNKGLYDGMDLEGSDSNAALAKMLGLPVVLVIDTMGMTRGIAPLLLGYQQFDPAVRIAGVILNRVAGPRHEGKLIESVERHTDIPVIGSIPRFRHEVIEERHLGLIPAHEQNDAARTVDRLADVVGSHVDLERLLSLGADLGAKPAVRGNRWSPADSPAASSSLRIGIARDEAFGFYYADDLEQFERLGAELISIDMIRDQALPPLDGLFIGGGFPETAMERLSANTAMRASVRRVIEAGLPCYAECGGLMYLSRSIAWRGRELEMVGVVPGRVTMSARPHGRGYIQLEEASAMPWPGAPAGEVVAGHEFHYSELQGLPADARFAYRVRRGTGIRDGMDGFVYRNLLASYAHLRDKAQNHWVARFLQFASAVKAASQRP